MTQQPLKPETPPIEKPPVFEKWGSWYALVLGALGFVIGLLFLLTNSYK